VRESGEGEESCQSDGGERGVAEGGVEDGKGEGFGEEPAHGDHQAGILLVKLITLVILFLLYTAAVYYFDRAGIKIFFFE